MITIRTATVADAEKLLAIYAPYVENTAITFEYTVPSVGGVCRENKEYPCRLSVSRGREGRGDTWLCLCQYFQASMRLSPLR